MPCSQVRFGVTDALDYAKEPKISLARARKGMLHHHRGVSNPAVHGERLIG